MATQTKTEPSEPILTEENYYSQEMNNKYMSVHTYFEYAGTLGRVGCEARAEAIRKGEWVNETSEAMLVGSYVDRAIEGTLESFKKEHPEIFTMKGELKAQYKLAETMLERMRRDDYFMRTLSGDKQTIMTAYMFGCEWKCKIDSYIKGKAIVDLKTSTDLHKSWRIAEGYASVPEYWGYTTQLAIYQEIVRINTGEKLPCYLSFVTKEKCPELVVVQVDQETMDKCLEEVEANMPQIIALRNGEIEPTRCECCDYCKSTRVLHHAIGITDLIGV